MIHDHFAAATDITLTATSGATCTTLKELDHVVAMIVPAQTEETRGRGPLFNPQVDSSPPGAAQRCSDHSFGDVSAPHTSGQRVLSYSPSPTKRGTDPGLSVPSAALSLPSTVLSRNSPPSERARSASGVSLVNGRLWRWTLHCLSLGQRAPSAPWETRSAYDSLGRAGRRARR